MALDAVALAALPIGTTNAQAFASNAETIDRVVNGTAATVATRTGKNVLSLDEAMRKIGFETPVAFASGLSITRATQTVANGGLTYHANPTSLPFATTGTFNSAQWLLVSNITAQDLASTAAGKGAALIGYQFAAPSAVPRTALGKLRERADLRDFGAKCDGVTLDTAAVQAAVDWCAANGEKLHVPAGTCLIGGITVSTQGLHLEGVGYKSVFKIQDVSSGFGFKFINPNGGVGEPGHWSSDANLRYFRITSPATAGKLYGLWFENSEFNLLERVQVELSSTYNGTYSDSSCGLYGTYTQDGTVYSSSFSAGSGDFAYGVYLRSLSTAMRPNNNVWVDCRFQSNGGYGFRNEAGEAQSFRGCSWQDNVRGGHVEAADGSGNGARGTVIDGGCWFELNGGASVQADVAEMLTVKDSFFPDASTTSALYISYGVQCLFDGNQSIGGAKPITVAGGSGNIIGRRNRGFGAVTIATGAGALDGNSRIVLTDATTVTVDASAGTYFTLSGSAGRTIAAPTNPVDGKEIVLELANSSGASISHTFASAWAFGASSLAVAAGKLRTMRFAYNSPRAQWIICGAPSSDV